MRTKALLALISVIIRVSAFGQTLSLDLTFTAVNNMAHVRLDSIKVMNRTQGSDTIIYWPDTTLTYNIIPGDLILYAGYSTGYPVGIPEPIQENKEFQLYQNYPNPVKDQSVISMYIPGKGTVNVMITDNQGRVINSMTRQLDKGNHSFLFTPGDGQFFLLTARWNGISRSIRILSTGTNSGRTCRLSYAEGDNEHSSPVKPPFKAGLVMQESGILDYPVSAKTYTFQFATNIPCPGSPAFTYQDQVFHTTQIYSQCWLRENLNLGTMIPGVQDMANNNILEKYCYNDSQDSCTKYGGLYQWDEAMQYTTLEGAQGICPPGWHIPTDEEWKVLEGAADSKYGIGDPEWNKTLIHGFDAGKYLKATSGWNAGGNGNDLLGFSAKPDGARFNTGFFTRVGYGNYWWTSSEYDLYDACHRFLKCYYPAVYRDFDQKVFGFSVRCLRN